MHADARRRWRRDDEAGSMVIAFMVMIMASGLMLTLAAYVMQGQHSTRFDRDHTRVVQGADAGVHDVLYRLGLPAGNPQRITTTTSQAPQPLGAYTYWWTASPNAGGQAGRWEVVSTGRLNGEERTVRAWLEQPRPFQLAAFADKRLTFVGSNNADSYTGTGWNTGEGEIGSNGSIILHGSAYANDANLYGPPDDPARCSGSGTVALSVCAGYDYDAEKVDIASDTALAFIADALSNCPTNPPARVISVATTLTPGTYCYSTLDINADVTVTGTSANPVKIYLTGASGMSTLSIANNRKVNCPGCTTTNQSKPDAGALQVYTASEGDVRIGNNGHVAAALYAPRGSCRGNPSNAQTHFYGSMVCATITNQGGWNFHYDMRLRDLGAGGYDIIRWSEQ